MVIERLCTRQGARSENRALIRRTRESQHEGRDTDDERGVKSELRGRMGKAWVKRTVRESKRANFRKAFQVGDIFRHGGTYPAGGTGPYLLERLAAARRGTRVLGDNARLRFLLARGLRAERRADGDADGAASAEARDARRRNGVVRTERERACAGAGARAHRSDARRRRGADGGTDENRRHDGPRCPRPAVSRVTGTPARLMRRRPSRWRTITVSDRSRRTRRRADLAGLAEGSRDNRLSALMMRGETDARVQPDQSSRDDAVAYARQSWWRSP